MGCLPQARDLLEELIGDAGAYSAVLVTHRREVLAHPAVRFFLGDSSVARKLCAALGA
jgi:hypothetical protein